jgi:hypothetical protein
MSNFNDMNFSMNEKEELNILDRIIKFFFKRTLFKVEENRVVELVYITKETKYIEEGYPKISWETLLSDSRELHLTELPSELAENLISKDLIKEEFLLTEQEAINILENYKHNLFNFSKDKTNLN